MRVHKIRGMDSAEKKLVLNVPSVGLMLLHLMDEDFVDYLVQYKYDKCMHGLFVSLSLHVL